MVRFTDNSPAHHHCFVAYLSYVSQEDKLLCRVSSVNKTKLFLTFKNDGPESLSLGERDKLFTMEWWNHESIPKRFCTPVLLGANVMQSFYCMIIYPWC